MSMKHLFKENILPERNPEDKVLDKNSEAISTVRANLTQQLEDVTSTAERLQETNSKLSSKMSELEKLNEELKNKLESGAINPSEFEKQHSKANAKVIQSLDPSSLTKHPTFYNRNKHQFTFTKKEKALFKKFTETKNYDLIENVDQQSFLGLTISIYLEGKNTNPICFTTKEGSNDKLITYGERRQKVVLWLHENGFSNNGETDVILQGFEENYDTTFAFLRTKFQENDSRKTLAPMELAITISQMYLEHASEYDKGGPGTALKNQRKEGYILEKLKRDIPRSIATIKKYNNIGQNLGIEFDDAIGPLGQFISLVKLDELQSIANPKTGKLTAENVATTLKHEVNKSLSDDEIHEATNDIAKFKETNAIINKIIDDFTHAFKPKESSTKTTPSIKRQKVAIKTMHGLSIVTEFDESKVSEKLKELLNNPVELEDVITDALSNYI